MKRLLVVSPSFPPTSAAELHRVRVSLPHYGEFGWQPFVLAVRPDAHGGLQEPELLSTVPTDVPVDRCGALPVALTGALGIRAVGLRALPHLYAAGASLIRRQAIDLVFFSTTMFPALVLGRLWKARLGTPYVFDMQDPWKSDYRGEGAPRGLKAAAARLMHGRLEPFAMRRVDGIVSVSPAYAETLQRRYPWIQPDMCSTIPFAASRRDMEAARLLPVDRGYFDPSDGHVHGVSVGRGGSDLSGALRILLEAVRLRDAVDGVPGRIRLSFIGTDYASDDRHRTIEPVAQASGAAAVVREWPARVPYLRGLGLLAQAHFTVILGSDDQAYNPSKIHSCLMAGRPFVAILHESSPAVPLLRQSGAGIVATFGPVSPEGGAVRDLAEGLRWVLDRAVTGVQIPSGLIDSFGARELTRRQCHAFEAAIRHASPHGVPCVGSR